MKTDKEVLRQAIKLAQRKGWEETGRYVYLMAYLFGNPNCFSGEGIMREMAMGNVYKLLFSHDFAKAFWGTEQKTFKVPYWVNNTKFPEPPSPERKYRNEIHTAWKYQLQQMVLWENPIDYLRMFVDNVENPLNAEKSVLEKIEDETIDFSPVKSVTIILSNQCKVPSNSVKALVFSTRGGNNEVFSIPLEHILNAESSALEINPSQKYPAMKFTITSWIYEQIKHHLVKMDRFNYQLMPNND